MHQVVIQSDDQWKSVRMRWVGDCLLVDDPMPIDLLARLPRLFPKGAVLDPHLARMAGAMNAMGMPSDTASLAIDLGPRMRAVIDARYPDMTDGAREWLAVGQHWASSVWLFHRIMGIPLEQDTRNAAPHPLDPADLLRVLDMLQAVQGSDDLPGGTGDVSPQWNDLSKEWPALVSTLRQELEDVDGGGTAPITYRLMQGILDQ